MFVFLSISMIFLLACIGITLLLTVKKQTTLIQQLQHISTLRGMFVTVAAHDFRNPMTTIYSSVDLIEMYYDQLSTQERKKIFQHIRQSVKNISNMMDGMLILGQLQHKQLSYSPHDVELIPLCKQIISDLDPEYERTKIYISNNCPMVVSIDTVLFRHILFNLLSNALKYSQQAVHIEIYTDNKHLYLQIIDKGIGIPPHEIHKLSKLFTRCSNAKNIKGIGIGMHLICHCVKLHKGHIYVYSEENKGTIFKVQLPLKP